MTTQSKKNYIIFEDWYRDVVGGQDVILRGISAIEYMGMFSYLYRDQIDVYSKTQGRYTNVDYLVVDSFDNIDYFQENGVMCTTFNQTVNDMLDAFDSTDMEPLARALRGHYHFNGRSFENLTIKPGHQKKFEYMISWAMEYFDEE